MAKLLAFVPLPSGPVSDPGSNGPIPPSGNEPEPAAKKHAVGFLVEATSQSKVVLLSLADLRLQLPPNSSPNGARVVVYHGKGEVLNPAPLVQQTNLVQDGGSGSRFKMNKTIASKAAAVVVAGNTVGIEINSEFSAIPLMVSSSRKLAAAKSIAKSRKRPGRIPAKKRSKSAKVRRRT